MLADISVPRSGVWFPTGEPGGLRPEPSDRRPACLSGPLLARLVRDADLSTNPRPTALQNADRRDHLVADDHVDEMTGDRGARRGLELRDREPRQPAGR